MRRTIAIILCGLCQNGCVSHTRMAQPALELSSKPAVTDTPVILDSGFPDDLKPLSDSELRDLVMAADDAALKGGTLPDRILRRMAPVEVYHDRSNIVIALQRVADFEWGYYIVPLLSPTGPVSFNTPFRDDRGWTWMPLAIPGLQSFYVDTFYSGRICEYSRKR